MDSGKLGFAAWLFAVWLYWIAPAFLLAMVGFEIYDYLKHKREDGGDDKKDEEENDD